MTIKEYFSSYCSWKTYQLVEEEIQSWIRLKVSDWISQISCIIYQTGSIVIQWKESQLKTEFNKMKKDVEEDPSKILGTQIEVKSICTKYNIILNKLREEVCNTLTKGEFDSKDLTKNPTPSEDYRLKLSRWNETISLTQYKNWTLLIQGKTDSLHNSVCDDIELIIKPDNKEVILRFLWSDEEVVKNFATNFTPESLTKAEESIKSKLPDAYDFLEEHDKKWLISSVSLGFLDIPLPEYTPIVMPAAKAFEGYIKKLLVTSWLYPQNHFIPKNSSFWNLLTQNDPQRLAFIKKDTSWVIDTYLKKIDVDLNQYRNFFMHSSGNYTSNISTIEEARRKLEEILKEMQEIHTYFKSVTAYWIQ